MADIDNAHEILESVPLPAIILLTDVPAFTITAVNKAFLKTTGAKKRICLVMASLMSLLWTN